jgi:hypothetical protein
LWLWNAWELGAFIIVAMECMGRWKIPIRHVFGALSQCKRKPFSSGSKRNGMLLCTSSVEETYFGGVYVILILKI